MSKNLSDLVTVYRKTSFGTSRTSGTYTVENQEEVLLLKELILDVRKYGIACNEDEIYIGNTLTLTINPPRVQIGSVYQTMEDLLRNPQNRTTEPAHYYISQLDFFNSDRLVPALIEKYRVVIALLGLLKESAAYMDPALNELVYFDTDTLKIPVNYNVDDLDSLNKDCIESIIMLFNDDTHREQKLTILGNCVKSLCSVFEMKKVFPQILSDAPAFNESIRKGYRIFVSGFSYEKIIDQLKAAKIEEFGKIHKSFSDIQNQILGIPISTMIVSTQMKKANGWDVQAISNTAIIIGSLIFAILLIISLFNQMQTLNTIEEEVAYKKKQAKKLYKSIYEDICITFDAIDRRLFAQRIAIRCVGAVLAISVIYSVAIYFFLTY